MAVLGWALVLSSAVPLMVAARANRATTLFPAVLWGAVAWVGWAVALAEPGRATTYAALGLTGCAGVAVLGARRPGMAAWNFVVAGLLAVLALPLAESLAFDIPLHLDTFRWVFLLALIGITVINYLPTRLTAGAAFLGVACAWGMDLLASGAGNRLVIVTCCAGLAPWAAWAGYRVTRDAGSPFDRLWRDFRDRFGLIWGLRLREQFNRAADNADLGLELTWSGARPTGPAAGTTAVDGPAYDTLAALMKRFGLP